MFKKNEAEYRIVTDQLRFVSGEKRGFFNLIAKIRGPNSRLMTEKWARGLTDSQKISEKRTDL